MKKLIIHSLLLISISVVSQEIKNYELSGYFSVMGSHKTEYSDSLFPVTGKNQHMDALVHNRVNFFYYPANNFEFSVQVRNRFMWNEDFANQPYLINSLEEDPGYMQMAWNLVEENKSVLNTNIDRFYGQYTKNNLEIRLGRQRVNWSQTFAWNPNDIFNASNYFDFDYPEKPGSDALRITYYTGMASSAEAVVKIDHYKNVTAAALYKHNIKGYDIQFLSGVMNQEEYVVGGGWSGNISSAGFRGEVTAILPYKDSSEYMHSMDNVFMSSIGFDYSFANSAYLMFEMLYSNNDVREMTAGITSVFNSPITVRNLAFSRLSALASFSYPVHPLVNVSFSGMGFYKINGFYLGPNIDFNVAQNISASFYWQYFYMFLSKENMVQTSDLSINYLFFRLKYNL